jgi:O-antigen ligase
MCEGPESRTQAGDRWSRLPGAEWTLWLLLAVMPPLAVNLWGQQPFDLPKVLLVRTLVWLLASLLLAGYLLSFSSPGRLRSSILHAANPLPASIALLALVIAITTATAADVGLSLWGSIERGQGAVTLLTYLLLCCLAASRLRAISLARQMVMGMVLAGALIVLMALLQAAWPALNTQPPLGLVSDARSPLFATLGRANFLGAYLALLTPLALALLLTARPVPLRLLWAAILAGQILVIALTLARSAWLATIFSLSLFSLLCMGPRLNQSWRRPAWAGIGLLFLAGPLAVLLLGPQQSGSVAARLAIWQGSIDLIRQQPLLGYGADALGLVFPQVYPPELVYLQGRHLFVDRAHNLFLDWTLMAGLPGLLAFSLLLGAFVFVVGRGMKNARSWEERVLLAGILAAVVGNVTNNLVSFDVTATATASWLLMGMGVGLATRSTAGGESAPIRADNRPWRWALVGILFVGVGAAIWQMNGRALMADVAARSAHRYAQAGEWTQAVESAQRAAAFWPVEPAHHLSLSQTTWQLAQTDPASAPHRLAQAERALETAQQLRPADATVWLHSAHFYAAASRQFGAESHAQAEAAFRRAASLAPTRAAIYTSWGRFHLEAGEAERAAPLLRQAVRLDASSGMAYLHLTAAELALGRLDAALADYREAVRLLPESEQADAALAALRDTLFNAPE